MMKIDAKDLTYLQTEAALMKIDVNALLAVIEIESGGKVGNPLPIIRWEGHYFDRLIPANLRDRARALGLSSPNAGAIKNPSSQLKRYEIVEKAAALDAEAAYSSISIGVGQVMGSHAKDLGYNSAKQMFDRAKEGFQGQVELMVRFIKFNKLVDELQRLDWSAFARAYNGPNYRQNRYHLNMKEAFERYTGGKVTTVAGSADGMIRMGSQGSKVREVQQLLTRAGFPVKVDGDFGPSTKEAVENFQRKYKLDVDGVVGPKTQAELVTWKTAPDEVIGQPKPTEIPGVKNGINLGIFAGLLLMLQQFFNNSGDRVVIIGAIAIGIVALFWAIDAYQKSKLTYEGTK